LVVACGGSKNGIIKNEIEKMLNKMKDDIKKPATEIIDKIKMPYTEQSRDRFDGPRRIGRGLDLREDFYSVAFLNWMKIEYITGKPDPSPR